MAKRIRKNPVVNFNYRSGLVVFTCDCSSKPKEFMVCVKHGELIGRAIFAWVKSYGKS